MSIKNIAIVTGASSGLGKEFVKLLLKDKELNEIFVLSRNNEKLENLATEYGEKIKPYVIDLSDRNNIKVFGEFLKAQNVKVKLLINNAGYAKFCSYEDISIDESLNMIDLNICGLVSMGLTCIPFMEEGAHIINIASLASFQPVPYQNIYSSTKSFVKNYSRALNVELKSKRITVTAVCPGWINTELYKRASIDAKKAPNNFTFMSEPKAVAEKALKDAYNGKDVSIYGKYANFCHLLSKILPEKWIMKLWLIQQGL